MLLDTPYFKLNGTISCPDPLICLMRHVEFRDIQLHLDAYTGIAPAFDRRSWTRMLSTYHAFWVIAPGTVPIKKKFLPCMSSFVLTCTFHPLIHGAEETFCQDEVTFRGQENGGLCFV